MHKERTEYYFSNQELREFSCTYYFSHPFWIVSGFLPFNTYLRYPDVRSHLWSLYSSTLIPALFLARTLSPTRAFASPASPSMSSSSSSSFSTSASMRRHTSFARCSASLSPAFLNSLCSWCRLIPEKMLEHPDFLLRWLENFHCTGWPSSVEVDAGASAMSHRWRTSKW